VSQRTIEVSNLAKNKIPASTPNVFPEARKIDVWTELPIIILAINEPVKMLGKYFLPPISNIAKANQLGGHTIITVPFIEKNTRTTFVRIA
jgi:hypothetical protein